MVIVVEGTKAFSDYEIFMRAMTVALSTPNNDNQIQVWSLGPHKINSFTAGFCNSAESYLKQKGFKVSFSKVTEQWVRQNVEYIDYYAYFSLPKEPLSKFATHMEHQEDVEMGIFRY
jgi:putative hemolysin